MSTELLFTSSPQQARQGASALIVAGLKERLLDDDVKAELPKGAEAIWPAMVDSLSPGDAGQSATTWLAGEPPLRLIAVALPEPCSRHNSPARPHALASLVGKATPKPLKEVERDRVAVIIALEDARYALASACAVARAFPTYSHPGVSDEPEPDRELAVAFLAATGELPPSEVLGVSAEAVRLAAKLTDMPTSELNTEGLVAEAKRVAAEVGAEIEVKRGQKLREEGFGGLWNVGKAAADLPALVVLSWAPEGEVSETLAWVGKGIVYDTGGLSIKGKEHMPGMKGDMGGAAAILAAFKAAVRLGLKKRLHAILCLAENAVGPDSMRPDDILEMYSGKTVEVNNTDAEGRLVLADGVAYAVKHLSPDVIVDVATLTGAQLIATGHRHAAVVTNDEAREQATVEAGRISGELVHPLPYCPEFYRPEFKSKVADLKNSVKDRMNAQASCAGQFIAEHLGDFEGPWIHLDIAGPSVSDERGTGFGVALLLQLFGAV